MLVTRILFGLGLLAFPLAAANAQTMNAQAFYQRATALEKKGPLAILSRGEIRDLMNEAKAAGQKARDLRLAAVAQGRKPAYCPPAEAQAMGSKEFMERLAAVPAADRAKINMTDAMTRMLAKKYPCPA